MAKNKNNANATRNNATTGSVKNNVGSTSQNTTVGSMKDTNKQVPDKRAPRSGPGGE